VKRVLVTGGASGIGAGTAEYLAHHGNQVSIIDRVDSSAAPWWHALPSESRADWIVADAQNRVAYVEALKSVASGGIDGLVTSAGISIKESFLDSTDDAWDQTIGVNLMGTVLAAREVARAMVAAGVGGSIVTLASTVGSSAVATLGSHYHASKGAIVAFTKSLASELGPYGIRANAVAPGLVKTPLTQFMRETLGEDVLTERVPLRSMAQPIDVARAIGFLLSADASMVTGQVVPIDAGQLMVMGQPLDGFAEVSVDAESIAIL